MKSLPLTLLLLSLWLPIQSEAVTFKIASIAPDGTSWMKQMRKGAKEVKQRTNGRVKFRFYPGGIMGNDKSVLRKIRIGQLHGGALTGGGLSDIYPDSQIYSLPFVFRNLQEVDYVRGKMESQLIKGIDQSGFVSFGISGGGFAYMMSKEPVHSINDLLKSKVWMPEGDNVNRAAFSSFNITPISLPLPDVLTGLQTGLIDTVAASTVGAIALQWHSRVKYLNNTPLLYLYGTMVVKKSKFKKLSVSDQAIVREVMNNVFAKLNTQNRKDNLAAMEALKNQGIEIIDSPTETINRWRTGSAQAMDKLSQEGVFSPAILTTLRKHLSTYRNGKDVAQSGTH
ncbi:MAG: TRAP transporter substrate-binding protein DctP [Chromatiales bacterium]|nr:TRAP transporter substrate-binding protein DctP [Chromatiales bacterium]